MGTITDELNYLNGTKVAIHDAIVAKGVNIAAGSTFRSYASKISEIQTGSGSSNVAEWTQSAYDAAFQSSLTKIDATLSANLSSVWASELATGKAYAHIKVDNSDSEFAKLTVNFTGACTIDWGDGTTSTPASGTAIEHAYSYQNANLINLTNSASKFAIISITCTGGSITGVVFNDNNSTGMRSKYLAINVAGNNISTISVSNIYTLEYFSSSKNACTNMGGMFTSCISLTTIPALDTSKCTDMGSMFYGCYSLTTIPLLNTSVCTSTSGMFSNCRSLTTIPLLNTSACTTMGAMFNNCVSLTTIPALDTSKCTDMSSMFVSCYVLTTIPALDTSKCINMAGMFTNCYSLTTIPLLNTSVCKNMSGMFSACNSLTTIPALNTSACTDMSSMFNACFSLTAIPAFNTSACVNMMSMFNACYSLTTIPLLDTSKCTSMSSMFSNCRLLTTIPALNTSVCTNMGSMFNNCYSLTTIPLLNTSACTSMTTMFSNCYSLTTIPALNTSVCVNMGGMFTNCNSLTANPIVFMKTSDISSNRYSAATLNQIYTNLPTVVIGQTLVVTGNWGTSTDNTAIATAKGWTISG